MWPVPGQGESQRAGHPEGHDFAEEFCENLDGGNERLVIRSGQRWMNEESDGEFVAHYESRRKDQENIGDFNHVISQPNENRSIAIDQGERKKRSARRAGPARLSAPASEGW
jgi:hypothetical protein